MTTAHVAKSLRRAAKKARVALDVARLTSVAKRAMEAAPTIKPWGPHRIRHSFGFRMVPKIGVEHTRALMGHSDIRTTMRYAKSDVDRAFEALARIS